MPGPTSDQLLIAGVINTLWLVIEMLDEKGVLPREEAHAWLSAHLQETKMPPEGKFPLAQLVASLAKPKGQQPGWTPTVHDGGRSEDP